MADINFAEILANPDLANPGDTVLPDGAYTFEIIRANKAKDTSIAIELKVVGGPEAGKKVLYFQSFSEKAQGIALQNLAALGVTREDLQRCVGLEDAAKLLPGRVVEVSEYSTRDVNGRKYPQVPIGGFRLVSTGAGIPAATPQPAAAPPVAPPAATTPPPAPPAAEAPVAAAPPPAAPPTAPAPVAPAPVAPAPPAAPAPAPPAAPDGSPSPFA